MDTVGVGRVACVWNIVQLQSTSIIQETIRWNDHKAICPECLCGRSTLALSSVRLRTLLDQNCSINLAVGDGFSIFSRIKGFMIPIETFWSLNYHVLKLSRGIVSVLFLGTYGSTPLPAAFWGFGHSLACGDFDGDGISDLAVSSPTTGLIDQVFERQAGMTNTRLEGREPRDKTRVDLLVVKWRYVGKRLETMQFITSWLGRKWYVIFDLVFFLLYGFSPKIQHRLQAYSGQLAVFFGSTGGLAHLSHRPQSIGNGGNTWDVKNLVNNGMNYIKL